MLSSSPGILVVGRHKNLIQEVDGFIDRLVIHSVFVFLGNVALGAAFPTHISPCHLANTKHFTQTIVELEFSPDGSSDSYDLCYKVHQQTWEQQMVKVIGNELLTKVHVVIEELEPGTTYCFRLISKASDGSKGEPGPELIIDTEAISCTPKRRRCVIM